MLTPAMIVRDIRALFADEKKWTKDFFALDGDGEAIEPYEAEAKCFCIQGAVDQIAGMGYFSDDLAEDGNTPNVDEAVEAISAIIQEEYRGRVNIMTISGAIVDFNDHSETTLDDVRGVLDKAIVKLEAVDAPHPAS